jgi:hypothetical protein
VGVLNDYVVVFFCLTVSLRFLFYLLMYFIRAVHSGSARPSCTTPYRSGILGWRDR